MYTLSELASHSLNISLTPQQEAAFDEYARVLAEWNEKINLTAITAPADVRVRHFLDSLTLARVVELRAGMRILDVGTGAGFPGIPLQIMHPGLHLTLLEATGKKIAFLDHVVGLLGLPNVVTLKARAEEAGHMPGHRQAYDVAVARAVARLPILLEYLLPFVKTGGVCIAMKGTTAHAEAADSARALRILGGRVQDIMPFQLPSVEDTHHLIIVEKIASTPVDYPRRPGLPNQDPL
jgi:16S rRNA (guanine527-N7)-methyltransferase